MASMLALPCSFYIALLCLSLSLHLALAIKCKKLDTCSCEMDDGTGIISFQSQDNKDGKPKLTNIPQSVNFEFDWNPCTTLTDTPVCKDNNVCQRPISPGKDSFPSGGSDTTFSMVGNNVVMTYSKVKYGGHTRYTALTLKCDKKQDAPSIPKLEEDVSVKDTSRYSGTLTSKCACPKACPYSKASSSGLSVGSIILIIFFSLLFLYFVVGIIINKFARNKEGSDVIPNHSFWADFPFLIKDGCVFSCSKIRYCCGSIYHKAKGDSEYAQI